MRMVKQNLVAQQKELFDAMNAIIPKDLMPYFSLKEKKIIIFQLKASAKQ